MQEIRSSNPPVVIGIYDSNKSRARQYRSLTIKRSSREQRHSQYPPLREKCPNTEFFLVRIRENTDQKKLRIWTFFTQC